MIQYSKIKKEKNKDYNKVQNTSKIKTRIIWKMLGPFATMSRLTPIQQVSPLYCRTPPAHRCPQRRRRRRRRKRQRVTEGTAMAPWNGPNKPAKINNSSVLKRPNRCYTAISRCRLRYRLAWASEPCIRWKYIWGRHLANTIEQYVRDDDAVRR